MSDTSGADLACVFRTAPIHELPADLVEECMSSRDDRAALAERQFRQAFVHGLGSIPRDRRSVDS